MGLCITLAEGTHFFLFFSFPFFLVQEDWFYICRQIIAHANRYFNQLHKPVTNTECYVVQLCYVLMLGTRESTDKKAVMFSHGVSLGEKCYMSCSLVKRCEVFRRSKESKLREYHEHSAKCVAHLGNS